MSGLSMTNNGFWGTETGDGLGVAVDQFYAASFRTIPPCRDR
jgi:hypothetical protein